MKHQLFATLLITLTLHSVGQRLPYVGAGQSFIFANQTNQFLNSRNVNWAMDTEESFSFSGTTKVENLNIFNYLITKALAGKLKAYTLRNKGFEGFENSTYSESDKFPYIDLTKDQINFILTDSLKTIKFHEIFYLNNYSLSCQIISAAPSTNYATASGISLEMQDIFYCCKSSKSLLTNTNNKDIIHLNKIDRNLNFDSIENSKLVKQTYGLNIVQSIWTGASLGYIKLLDTKTNKVISANNVLNYSILDSVQVPFYDSTGSIIGHTKQPGDATFPYKLVNSIQFVQDFYYDTRRNVFFSTISNCYLFVKIWDEANSVLKIEKRFKVL
jgi:hypothetical protein